MCSQACLWDSDTLADEKAKKPKIADVILGTSRPSENSPRLKERIADLKRIPREKDPAWWNDPAAAYIRLGQSEEAVKILEPLLQKFPKDYGIHANLGTAYHLLGRYKEAEREIARDLEINPNAHFGLEKYHLALLQYLARDRAYRKKHVYVEEWTASFFGETGVYMSPEPPAKSEVNKNNLPSYLLKWNLAEDPKFDEGVLYMASLNPKEPACFTMLAIACIKNHDYNLAAAALDKAIALGSPQSDHLTKKSKEIRDYIKKSQGHGNGNVRMLESSKVKSKAIQASPSSK